MHTSQFCFIPAIIVTLVLAAPVSAKPENLDALDQRIAKEIANSRDGFGQPVPLDRRLQLPECPTPAEIEIMPDNMVAVRCPERSWRVRVTILGNPRSKTNPVETVLIARNDLLDLVYVSQAFSISVEGKALDSGTVGQTIRVENTESHTIVSALVISRGRAELHSEGE